MPKSCFVYAIAGVIFCFLLAILSLLFFRTVSVRYYPQDRAKVARAEAEMRNLQNTLESFYLDHNSYPLPSSSGLVSDASLVVDGTPYFLTTPVTYITSIPFDPFINNGVTHSYQYGSDGKTYYILSSWGPDRQDGLNGVEILDEREYTGARLDESKRAAFRGAKRPFRNFLYHPSNGAASAGDILRVGP